MINCQNEGQFGVNLQRINLNVKKGVFLKIGLFFFKKKVQIKSKIFVKGKICFKDLTFLFCLYFSHS